MVGRNDATFGELLRSLRERAGLTQEELAERAGLSRDAISALERGRRSRPHSPTLAALADALGVTDPERSLLRQASRDSTTRRSVPESTGRRPVPEPPNRLIGREEELREVSSLLSGQGGRLVTLTGPGGVGKTRLALGVARTIADAFADGVIFISLAAVWDPALILPTVAGALGIRGADRLGLEQQLAAAHGDRPILLVLDNLEHLPTAPAVIAGILRASDRITVLATSRAPLRISGEQEYPIHPLAVTGAEGATFAIDLFGERAKAVSPGFLISDANHATIATICKRLDGLPLAIELAAARTKVLPPAALLERLDRNLDLLSGGPLDQDPRLQSIRSAIVWSYDLLDPTEQAAFRMLSVFAGGFTMDAAEQVLSRVLRLDSMAVLEMVTSLLDKSLVRRVADDDSRYAMLFTIRTFGIGELEVDPRVEEVHRAFVAWVQAMVKMHADAFRHEGEEDQWQGFAALEAERGNWRAALVWLNEHGPITEMQKLVTELGWFWYVRGPMPEAQFWMDRALTGSNAESPPDVLQAVHMSAGMIDHFMGENERALERLQTSLAIETPEVNWWWIGCCEMLLGRIYLAQGATIPAELHFGLARDAFDSYHHPTNAAMCAAYIGAIAWHRGDLIRARTLLESSIQTSRIYANPWPLAGSLEYLGLVAGEEGKLIESAELLREAMEIRVRSSQVGLEEGRQVRWEAGDWDDIAGTLSDLAVLATRTGREREAVLMFGSAAAIWRRVGRLDANMPERSVYARFQERLHRSLGADIYEQLWAEGERVEADRAVDLAQELLASIQTTLAEGPRVHDKS